MFFRSCVYFSSSFSDVVLWAVFAVDFVDNICAFLRLFYLFSEQLCAKCLVWYQRYSVTEGSVMRVISSEVPCIYGIESHSYFPFVGCRSSFCFVHLRMNSVV